MSKLLVSACLLGDPVRYDGKSKLINNELLQSLLEQNRIVGFCPEVEGGLPVPRPAAEIQGGSGADVIAGTARVGTRQGKDVTEYFLAGAEKALALCRQHDIRVAVLTELSPSCGSTQTYDGSFSHQRVDGSGVTATLLCDHDIAVFNQYQFTEAVDTLDNSDG